MENKKIYFVIAGVLLIASIIAYDVYGGREAGNGSGADGVTGNIQSTGQHLDATIAELDRAKSTINDLQAANQQLTEEVAGLRTVNQQLNDTIGKISESNSELERIIAEGKSRSITGQDLIKRGKQIVSGIQER